MLAEQAKIDASNQDPQPAPPTSDSDSTESDDDIIMEDFMEQDDDGDVPMPDAFYSDPTFECGMGVGDDSEVEIVMMDWEYTPMHLCLPWYPCYPVSMIYTTDID